MTFINQKSFSKIREDISKYDATRDELIKASRDIVKLSKLIIYSIHRDELGKAEDSLKEIESNLEQFRKLAKSDELKLEGSYKIAEQEYVEAKTFFDFVKEGKLTPFEKMKVSGTNYLLGLTDLTGEIGRYAVIKATKRDSKAVENSKEIVEEIFGEFLKMDLRNGELRKKGDSIKWNLKKIEEILYDIKK